MISPSRFAERLLTVVVRDPEWRDGVIGDLREEHAKLVGRLGATRARRWHLQQSVGIAARYGVHRLLRRQTPPRRWLAAAAQDPDGSWTAGFSRDVLYAWRAVVQRPALSGAVVLTLAVALAANATTFSLMDAMVLRPYRFPGVDRLIVAATSANPVMLDIESVARGDFRDWQRESRTVKQWAAYEWWDANLSGVEIPEQVPGFKVSPGFFSTLGVNLAAGREFLPDEAEPGAHRRAVLGHALWTRRFAADPAIVGRSVRLDGEPFEVVGIAPEGFQIPLGAQVWAPLAHDAAAWDDRRRAFLTVIGRLADDATLENARAEITTIVARQRRDFPETNGKREGQVVDFIHGLADPGAGPFMAVWQAAAGLLLLIACANIANLLMARGSERSQEYAVRLALGARRGRLFFQTILEGLFLSSLAIGVSIPLAAVGLGLFRSALPDSVIRFVPGWNFIAVDLRLFVVTAVLGTLAMLVFSLVPAFQATRAHVADSLRQSGRTLTPGRRRGWLSSTLATSQVALALALLFGSGLLLSVADRAVNGALGFDKNNVLIGQVVLPERAYADADKRRQFITSVARGMEQIPAVSDVGMTSNVPAGFSNASRSFLPEGQDLRENEAPVVDFRRVSDGYFAALRIPLLKGRWFDDRDRTDSTPVAVVSTGLAEGYWPGQDPLGRRFKTPIDGEWTTVIGVSGDVVHNWFTRRRDHTVYRPVGQDAPFQMVFTLRTVGDPTALAGDLRRAIAAVDADQPISMLSTLDQLVNERAAGLAFIANSLVVVALIALALSVLGIYSLMAYLTAQRTQEIGVRMALGAGRWQVLRLTTAHALRITTIGTLVGGVLAFGVGRVMQSVLFGLVSTNLWQLMVLIAILAMAALLAAYIPARRASRIDPMIALRES